MPEKTVCTVAQLWAKIGGGTKFTIEELKFQMAEEMDQGHPFNMIHNDIPYIVPLTELAEFFKTHSRPEKKLSVEEELRQYKIKYAAALKEIEALKGQTAAKKFDEAPLPFDGDDLKPEKVIPADIEVEGADIQNRIAAAVTPIQPDSDSSPL